MLTNRWQVYNYLKHHPYESEMSLIAKNPNLSLSELREGMKEFQSVQTNHPDAVSLASEGWGGNQSL